MEYCQHHTEITMHISKRLIWLCWSVYISDLNSNCLLLLTWWIIHYFLNFIIIKLIHINLTSLYNQQVFIIYYRFPYNDDWTLTVAVNKNKICTCIHVVALKKLIIFNLYSDVYLGHNIQFCTEIRYLSQVWLLSTRFFLPCAQFVISL